MTLSATSLIPSSEPLRGHAKEAARAEFRRARNFQIQGDLDRALVEYGRAIDRSPDLVEALNNRGVILGQLGHTSEALRDFDRSLAIQPEAAVVLFNRGLVLMLLGDYDAALSDLNRSIEIAADSPALTNRGILCASTGRNEEALRDFNAALAINPSDLIARLNRSSTLFVLERADEALADVEYVLAHKPMGDLGGEAAKLRSAVVEAQIERLVKRGVVTRPFRKPLGSKPRAALDLEKSLSELVIEGRA